MISSKIVGFLSVNLILLNMYSIVCSSLEVDKYNSLWMSDFIALNAYCSGIPKEEILKQSNH